MDTAKQLELEELLSAMFDNELKNADECTRVLDFIRQNAQARESWKGYSLIRAVLGGNLSITGHMTPNFVQQVRQKIDNKINENTEIIIQSPVRIKKKKIIK